MGRCYFKDYRLALKRSIVPFQDDHSRFHPIECEWYPKLRDVKIKLLSSPCTVRAQLCQLSGIARPFNEAS